MKQVFSLDLFVAVGFEEELELKEVEPDLAAVGSSV